MSGQIFNIQDDGTLVEMAEQPFANENLFQELLAKYPNLLAGDQIDSASPRKWLLVKREMGIPGEEEGADRWSLDHLFLDQDAIPTLVEVKRSSDTRLRREVVAQMLDYAANAVLYWPVEQLRAEFEKNSDDPVAALESLLGSDADPNKFWQKVKTNLQASKIRMLFVADVIPPELRRIVEFLNEQMDPAEVLAVEIKHFTGQGMKTLVPRVFGQTAEAEVRKGGGSRQFRQWNEESFFDLLEIRHGTVAAEAARTILAWARPKAKEIGFGAGQQSGSVYPLFGNEHGKQMLIGLWTYGKVSIQFGEMKKRPPFIDKSKRQDLLDRLNKIAGIELPADSIDKFPTFSITLLSDKAAMDQFLAVLDWAINEIRKSQEAARK